MENCKLVRRLLETKAESSDLKSLEFAVIEIASG
jgi:hypothetical protein